MTRTSVGSMASVSLVLASLGGLGCGSDSDGDLGSGSSGSAGSAGSGGSTNTGGSGGSGGTGTSAFDPDNPGLQMSLYIGVALMMGQPVSLAAGSFLITGREDLEGTPDSPTTALETCQPTEVVYTPACSGPQDCAPEQECLPQTDNNNAPIPNSERCVTPRSPLDVGPFTITGFASGPKTLSYNAGQNGGYTTPGGDGTIPYEEMAFGVTYTFEGAGDPAQSLGPFLGELRFSPELALTQPPLTQLPIGFAGVQVSVSQDLVLTWSGSNPGAEMTISLTGATMNESHTISCRTLDSGSFTIPAAMVQAAQLGDMAFLNLLTIERNDVGVASGEGMTSHDISGIQTAVINVAKLP